MSGFPLKNKSSKGKGKMKKNNPWPFTEQLPQERIFPLERAITGLSSQYSDSLNDGHPFCIHHLPDDDIGKQNAKFNEEFNRKIRDAWKENAKEKVRRLPSRTTVTEIEYDHDDTKIDSHLRSTAMVPIFTGMALVGILPVRIFAPRMPSLNPCRSTLLYALSVYAFVLWSSYHVIHSYADTILGRDSALDLRLLSVASALHVVPVGLAPLVWAETEQMSKRAHRMLAYENRFRQTTGRAMDFSDIRRVAWSSTFLIFMFPINVFLIAIISMPELGLKKKHFPAFMYGTYMQLFLGGMYIIRNNMMRKAAIDLAEALEKKAEKKEVTPAVIRCFRSIWIELREIINGEEGNVFGLSVLHMLFIFVMLMLTSYGAFAFSSVGKAWLSFGQATVALLYFLQMLTLCNSAHIASREMTGPFVTILDRISFTDVEQDVIQEIHFFHSAITCKSVGITLCGYVILNRNTLCSMISAIVTYLVVLVQFRQSNEEYFTNSTRVALEALLGSE